MIQNQRIKKIVISILISLSLMSFMKADDWYHFKSKKIGFKVDFPRKPVEDKSILTSEFGNLELNIFSYDDTGIGTDDNLHYMISYLEYPDSFILMNNTRNTSRFYRNAIDDVLKQMEGRLITEKIIYLGENEGREVKIELSKSKLLINVRTYLIGKYFYQIQVITKPSKDYNKSILRFMDSFALIDSQFIKK